MQRKGTMQHLVAAATLLGLSSLANAAVEFSFHYSDIEGVNSGGYSSDAKINGVNTPYTFLGSDGSSRVEISGWANNGNNDSIVNYDSDLRHWSGLSLDREGSSPQHAIDNQGPEEFVIFEFDQEVSLVEFQFGWPYSNQYDWDATILAFTDNTYVDPTGMVLDANSANSLTSNGWTAIGDYFNAQNSTAPRDISAQTEDQNIYSSYWAIGAYMPQVGAPDFTPYGMSGGNDYFKLKNITVVTQNTPPPNGETPVPATLLLLLLGLPMMRRRKA